MSILKVENIRKMYGKELVLDGVSFEITEPQIIALVGPNGSGKSTLLNIITNLLRPTSGQVTILESNNTNPSIFREIAFMQDNTVLYDYLTGYDHLQFIADVQSLPKKRITETAVLIGIESYINKKVKNYSLGMKQHLLIAMAIMNHPKLLILDEPLNGLDPTSAIKVRHLLLKLQDEGTAILLSSHNLGEIDRITTNILFLKNGRLIQEDISLFEKKHYLITVDKLEQARAILSKREIQVILETQRLKIPVNNNDSLESILKLLQAENIRVLDIEKLVTGSEDRYKKIFENQVKLHETSQV